MAERCPACGSDHVTVRELEDRELVGTEGLLVSVARDPGHRSVMPALSLKEERIDLECVPCGYRWRG